MKHYTTQDDFDPIDRLNKILDKINERGKKSLSKSEIDFLNSYSTGMQNEMNEMLIKKEMEEYFVSDDGLFSFKFDNVEVFDDIYYYKGKLTTPDKKIGKRIIKGEFEGSIIVYSDHSLALDFFNDKCDIFDMIVGYEYELDCFIDDVLYKIHFKK